ncbi:hypothetical protein IT413_05680 [Candidatus Peregrinibacteria bacterium]|nr:hypothetical protein [Candidatus Peregrinibacteria bacterium]
MASLPFSHRKEKNSGTSHGKIAKSILLSIALFFALSPSVLAHDFDFTNPEQLQIELSDALLVRPPPMTNPEKNTEQTQPTSTVPTPQNRPINTIAFLGKLLDQFSHIIFWAGGLK